jgi:hypothetical protein
MTAVLDESTTHPELSPFSKIADYGSSQERQCRPSLRRCYTGRGAVSIRRRLSECVDAV